MSYYSTDKIMSKHANYYITIGSRCNGKTTAWCKLLLDEYFEFGSEFAKVVRRQFIGENDVPLSWFPQYIHDYCREKYNHKIVFQNHNYYLVDLDDEYQELEKGQRKQRLKLKTFGKIFSLSQEVKYKSSEYPKIRNIVFEEFTLLEDINYLENEVEHFLSLLSTINRQRNDVKVIMIGNTIKKYNPYFNLFGININKLKLKPGTIITLQDKTYKNGAIIRLEFAESIYDDETSAPQILKISGNDVAIMGDFSTSQYIVDKSFDSFVSSCNPYAICGVIHDNKTYNVLQCTYKNISFIVITNRQQYKVKGYQYDIDSSIIQCIQKGYYSRKDLYNVLKEYLNQNILFSDEEIEYEISMLLRERGV